MPIDDSHFFEQLAGDTVPLDPRCPLVLLLDTSAAMAGAPVSGLNTGLRALTSLLARDALAALRVEIALVTFGEPVATHDFLPAGQFVAPVLHASGATPVGPAIGAALDMLAERRRDYKASGVDCYKPWIFLVTGRDESPYDNAWQDAARRVREAEAKKKAAFFSVGLKETEMPFLSRISSVRQPLRLQDGRFEEMFAWLASSMIRVAHSKVDGDVKLESPLKWGRA